MSSPQLSAPPSPPWKRLGGGAAVLIIGRLVSAVCGLVQVPLALQHLGPEAFGVWMTLAGLLWSLAILDGGLGYALQNRLATLFATNREADAAALTRLGARWLATLGAAVALLGAVVAWSLPWADWLGVTTPALRGQTPSAFAVTALIAAAALPLALSSRLAAARQETWLTGLWSALGSIVSLAAVFAAVRFSLPLAAFVAASGALPIVLYLGVAGHLAARHRPHAVAGTAPDTTGLAKESALFFLPQLGAVFIGAFVPVLVALFAGPLAVAPYSVLQRLFGLGLQLHTLALQPTWPAYTHAAARGDATVARRIYRTSLVVTVAAFALPMLLIAPFTESVLQLWLGAIPPGLTPALIWAVAGWHVMQTLGQPPAMLLNGLGRNAGLAAVGWIGLVATLGLSAWFGPRWGALGVIAALAGPYFVLNLPLISWLAQRALATIQPRPVAP